jgi:DNA modification methylase
METNKIYQGDCLIKLKELEDNSVDSIVTDPPYELGFMGKKWDNTGIANNKEMWKECFRLQGFLNDEIDISNLSDTQCYKLAGNGQSLNVVTKIFKAMFGEEDGM